MLETQFRTHPWKYRVGNNKVFTTSSWEGKVIAETE